MKRLAIVMVLFLASSASAQEITIQVPEYRAVRLRPVVEYRYGVLNRGLLGLNIGILRPLPPYRVYGWYRVTRWVPVEGQ